jgi:hypothetical protein
MAKTKLIAILDTETNMYDQEVFDIGVLIADTKGNIVGKFQWILDEVFRTKLFYENKRDLYLSYLDYYDHVKYVSVKRGLESLGQVLAHYKVKEVYAYNMAFDSRVIRKISQKYGVANPLDGYDLQCLWLWSCQAFFTKKSFRKFCETYPEYAKTPKGNFKTSAEIAFAYLQNTPNFEEVHTALEDCYIEYEIYLNCKKSNKPRLKGIASQVWLIPQTEEQISKLPPQFRTMQLNLMEQVEKAGKLFPHLKAEFATEFE